MAADEPWTSARVEAALRAAIWTLRCIPSKRLLPAGLRIAWPDVVREWDSYGWDRAAKPRLQATAEDIAAMDRSLTWVWDWLHPQACKAAQLVEDTSQIVLMRASSLTWERIGDFRLARWMPAGVGRIPGGNSINMLRRHHRAGIALIVDKLGGDAEPQHQPERWQHGVTVEIAGPGQTLGEGTYGPIHARARWAIIPRRR